jgi:hypothetical protein
VIVDPAYGLEFPRPSDAGYYGLWELRNDPSILERRLSELRLTTNRMHPVHAYHAESAPYTLVSSINWNKNFLTKCIHNAARARVGDALYAWPRPLVLEEPKLAMAALALAAAAGAALLPYGIRQVRCAWRRVFARRVNSTFGLESTAGFVTVN